MKYSDSAFTLIELMVVVSIISLLSSTIMVALVSARDKARFSSGQTFDTNLFRGFGTDSQGYWKLDEGSGTIAINSGLGNATGNGTIVNGVWITDGPMGRPALSFATGRNVTLPAVSTGASFTVAAWVRFTTTAQQPILSNRAATGLYFGTSVGKVYVYYTTGSPTNLLAVKNINDNKWHHVVWTSDNVRAQVYVDGTLDSSQNQTRTGVPHTGNTYIGYDAVNNQYFNGDISGVAVYNRAAVASEVRDLYLAQRSSYVASRSE